MRWVEPAIGTSRIVRRFLWLAKTIHGETRWLERAAWRETYERCRTRQGWVPRDWVNDER